jgi:hypothetical protein
MRSEILRYLAIALIALNALSVLRSAWLREWRWVAFSLICTLLLAWSFQLHADPKVEYPKKTEPLTAGPFVLMMFASPDADPATDFYNTDEDCTTALADWAGRTMESYPKLESRVDKVISRDGSEHFLVRVGWFFAICMPTDHLKYELLPKPRFP